MNTMTGDDRGYVFIMEYVVIKYLSLNDTRQEPKLD